MNNSKPDIKHLFEPRSVAVVGASSNPDKIGFKILDNIISSGFTEHVYPINPKGGEILGCKVYPSMEDLPEAVDIATIVVPAKYTFDAIRDCAKNKTQFLSIITSGFSEIGNLKEERDMVRFSHENGMRILGPNIFGVYSCKHPINATFGPKEVERGHVALLTQSGALGIAMMGKTKAENIGLSAVVSIGNKADIDEADLLEYLIKDEDTKVILMYIEGIKHGQRLIRILKEATKLKPVVVIKSGRSKRGALAAASHTGSLAGADEIFSDVMKQCGVLRAESIDEGLNWCKFLSETSSPSGKNCVIVTNGGGIGVLAADACEKHNVNLMDDLQTMKEVFSPVVPDFGSVKNPIDITGQGTLEDYEKSLFEALKHKEIDSVICLGCQTAVLNAKGLKESVLKISEEYKGSKPIVYSYVGGEEIEDSIRYLRSKGISVFSDVYDAVGCLGALYFHYQNMITPREEIKELPMDRQTILGIVDRVKQDGRTFLLANEAQELMNAAGITIPQSKIATNLDDAVRFSEEIGYPVVMKIVSKDIIHKSDAGGVALDLENKDEVVDAYQAIMINARRYKADAKIQGVEISEMVKKGIETIIGARQDEAFGPIVMFGLGGIYVEVMKDVSFRASPIGKTQALSMVKNTKAYPLLLGVRGDEQKDIEGTLDVILRIGLILDICPSISDIEINPLVVYDEGQGVKAVDVRILLSK